MEYHNREREINLKSMLFAVLYQWRKMLVFALVFALLLGGYKGVTAWREVTDPGVLSKYAADYQTAMEAYEQNKETLELRIADLEADVEQQRNYLENSVLMEMDPWNYYTAIASFYISTEYQILPEMVYQTPDISGHVLSAYVQMIGNSSLLSEIAEELDVGLQYLEEVVTVTGVDHILRISVDYTDEDGARRIMDLIRDRMDEIQAQIISSIGEHTIESVMDSVGPAANPGLADQQQEEHDRLEADAEALEKAREELAALVVPQQQVLSKRGVIVDAAVFAVVGMVLGCLIVAVLACGTFLFGDKVYSADEVNGRFGVKILGAAALDGKVGTFDRWLRAKDRRAGHGADYELIGANVCNYGPDAQRILVLSDADAAWSAQAAASLGGKAGDKTFVSAGSLLQDARAARLLPECDGAILVVRCKVSKYSAIRNNLEYVNDAGKRVIGCIVLDD